MKLEVLTNGVCACGKGDELRVSDPLLANVEGYLGGRRLPYGVAPPPPVTGVPGGLAPGVSSTYDCLE